MPEGDTVWRTARRLDQALSGYPLTVSDFRVPQYATLDLVGQIPHETVSRGKHILTRLDDVSVHTHLKMEGAWHVYRPRSPWRSPGFQARVVLGNEHWVAVGFRLGIVEVVPHAALEERLGHLGPDVLGPDWSAAEALRRLRRHPDVSVGEALLDQRNLAGIGNMYKAEACFLLGIHPETPVGRLDVLPALVDRAQRLVSANKERAEQTTTGNTRRGERMWVYGRAGQPCRRCGSTIRSTHQGAPGLERVTFWCPACQPVTGT